MAAKSMLARLNPAPVPNVNDLGPNAATCDKHGYIKKRSRHLKQWRKRYATIEENTYFCTYHNDTMTSCTEKIDISQSTIYYTIDKPKAFQISVHNNNNEFYFECDTILDANQWLTMLQKIIKKTTSAPNTPKKKKLSKKKKNISDDAINCNDLDLLTPQIIPKTADNYKNDKDKELQISDREINQIYMKAVGLYQHKHYEECARFAKSVLTMNPKHEQAQKLCQYLVTQKYKKDTNKERNKKKRKGIRQRFKTVAITKTSNDNSENSQNTKQRKKKQFTLFGKKNVKTKVINNETDDEKTEKQEIHPCQLEFRRFIMERIQLNAYYSDLCERFSTAEYNDIRFLKHFDNDLLCNEIGLRPLHSKCFLRKIGIFMDEIKLFNEWVTDIVQRQKLKARFTNITSDGLIDLFENNGIVTFEALYRYIASKNDLERIVIGDEETEFNKVIYGVLWKEISKIEKKQTLRISIVEQSYSQINASILGNGKDDNVFDQFDGIAIPEQQPINDSLYSINNEGVQNETVYIAH